MFAELWGRRELLFGLTRLRWRLSYRRSYLGPAWMICAPVIHYGILGLVFRWMTQNNSDQFILLYFIGVVPFYFFQQVMVKTPWVLLQNEGLFKRLNTSKSLFVLQSVLSEGVIVFILLLLAVALAALFGSLHWSAELLLIIPAFILLILFLCGLGLILSVSTVFFRDTGHLTPTVSQMIFFLTPIAYSLTQVPLPWREVLHLNPLTSFTLIFQHAILGGTESVGGAWLMATLFSLTVWFLGAAFIRKNENRILARM